MRPLTVNIYDWKTGEPTDFTCQSGTVNRQNPLTRDLRISIRTKIVARAKWFYYATLPIYLKYVLTDDPTSKELGLSAEHLGIDITFDNGETLTWNLSEIYPGLPPMPPFRLDK